MVSPVTEVSSRAIWQYKTERGRGREKEGERERERGKEREKKRERGREGERSREANLTQPTPRYTATMTSCICTDQRKTDPCARPSEVIDQQVGEKNGLSLHRARSNRVHKLETLVAEVAAVRKSERGRKEAALLKSSKRAWRP